MINENSTPDLTESHRYRRQQVLRKLTYWFVFSVIFAIVPILFNLIIFLTKGSSVTISALFAKGDLFLIAVAISASASGELFMNQADQPFAKPLFGGGNLIILVLAALWFGLISSGISVKADIVSWGSVVIFLLSSFMSGVCIVLSASPGDFDSTTTRFHTGIPDSR